MKSLSTIKAKYYELAKEIFAPKALICFAMTEQHDGSAHCETDGDEYLYVVTERGQTYETRRTWDPDELLYWLVSDLTFSMSCDFELKHRRPGEDSRRQLFAKNIGYMETISSAWAKRKKAELDAVLVEHPYNDEDG